MFLTPSIGLSVLVHLTIIIIFALRSLFQNMSKQKTTQPRKRGRIAQAPVITSQFLGVIIPVTVSVVILGSAFKLVELSISNKYSSINLARKYAGQIFPARPEAIGQEIALLPLPAISREPAIKKIPFLDLAPTASAAEINSFDCSPLFLSFANKYKWSLVNYLVEHGQPYSLKDRKLLATDLGLDNYHASGADNIKIMKILFLKNNEAGLSEKSACTLK